MTSSPESNRTNRTSITGPVFYKSALNTKIQFGLVWFDAIWNNKYSTVTGMTRVEPVHINDYVNLFFDVRSLLQYLSHHWTDNTKEYPSREKLICTNSYPNIQFSVDVDLENYRDPDLSITCWSLICCFVFGLASLIFYQRARTAKSKNQLEIYLVENSRSHLLALVGIVIGTGLEIKGII